MLRYDRQTRPGLVALYNIRPGNGAGPFLQPRSSHGAMVSNEKVRDTNKRHYNNLSIIIVFTSVVGHVIITQETGRKEKHRVGNRNGSEDVYTAIHNMESHRYQTRSTYTETAGKTW